MIGRTELDKKVKEKELTWATADINNPAEMEGFLHQQAKKAGERIRRAVKELQDLGIMDAEGRRVKKELPPDMQPDSETDV